MGEVAVTITIDKNDATEVIDIPVGYKEKDDAQTWYETMSIATVVKHDEYIYKLRMPNAAEKTKNKITVTLSDPTSLKYQPGGFKKVKKGSGNYVKDDSDDNRYSEAAGKEGDHVYKPPYEHEWTFRHNIPPLIHYKKARLENGDHQPQYNYSEAEKMSNIVNVKYMDPEYNRNKPEKPTIPIEEELCIDCVAVELSGSTHFINNIAGDWYITFTNPLKIFSNDDRLTAKEDLAKALMQIDTKDSIKRKKPIILKTQNMNFYVARDNVDALIGAVYPRWKLGFDHIIPQHAFFDKKEIEDMIVKFINKQVDPYNVEREKKQAIKELEKKYYQYVSVRPVWDTKDRFNNFFDGIADIPEGSRWLLNEFLGKDAFYKELGIQATDDEPDPDLAGALSMFGTSEKSKPETSGPKRSDIRVSYDDIKSAAETLWNRALGALNKPANGTEKEKLGDRIERGWDGKMKEFIENHVRYVLELVGGKHNNIAEDDYNAILEKFWGETDLSGNLAVDTLVDAMASQANSTPRKFELFKNLVEGTGIDLTAEDPETVREDIRKNIKKKDAETRELLEERNRTSDQDAKEKLKKQIFKLYDEEQALKREANAMRDDRWVFMKDVLARGGVKPANKAAAKPNLVYSLQELKDLLSRFSNIAEPENKDFQLLQEFAKYVAGKIGTDTIINLCKLYSDKNKTFKDAMKGFIDDIFPDNGTEWETEWFSSNRSIKSFQTYMEALVSIHYMTTVATTKEEKSRFKGRISERTNQLPLALRYAMCHDGIDSSKLDEISFEQLKKFKQEVKLENAQVIVRKLNRTIDTSKWRKQWFSKKELADRLKRYDKKKFKGLWKKKREWNTSFLFESETNRKQGLYDKTERAEGDFLNQAKGILDSWNPTDKKSKKAKKSSKTKSKKSKKASEAKKAKKAKSKKSKKAKRKPNKAKSKLETTASADDASADDTSADDTSADEERDILINVYLTAKGAPNRLNGKTKEDTKIIKDFCWKQIQICWQVFIKILQQNGMPQSDEWLMNYIKTKPIEDRKRWLDGVVRKKYSIKEAPASNNESG